MASGASVALDRPLSLLTLLDLRLAWDASPASAFADASVTKNVSLSIGVALAKKSSSIPGVLAADVSV